MVVTVSPDGSSNDEVPVAKQQAGGLASTRISRAIGVWEDAMCVATLAAIISIVFVAVVARFVYLQPLQWSDEVALGLFVWLTFIGSSAGWRRHEHPGVDVLVDRLPERARRAVWVVNYLVIVLVLVGAIVVGWGLAIANLSTYTLNLRIPHFYVDVSFVIGCALMSWHTIEHLERAWRGRLPVDERRANDQ